VLSSAAARADATARILAEALSLSVEHEEALGLDAAFDDLLGLVEGLASGEGAVLIVGHNPLFSRLVDHLAGGDGLGTGELSAIDLEPTMEGREVARYRGDEQGAR
jgi:phosphohistidine phosphatase SixA